MEQDELLLILLLAAVAWFMPLKRVCGMKTTTSRGDAVPVRRERLVRLWRSISSDVATVGVMTGAIGLVAFAWGADLIAMCAAGLSLVLLIGWRLVEALTGNG